MKWKCLFGLIILIGFLNLVSATVFDIGNDENDLTTFTFNSLTEKIEIRGNGALITNLFHFNIDTDALNQNLFFSLHLPYNDGRNLSVSSFEYLACGSQLAHENSIELYYPENPKWALNCGKYVSETINRDPITHISNSMYLLSIPLGDHEKELGRVGIYVQVKYFLPNYVIENEGEYEYISIDGFHTSKNYINFNRGNNKIILVMPIGTILEEKSNFNLKNIGDNGEITLEYGSPEEESFITFRDSKKQNSKLIMMNISIIFIAFSTSILMWFIGRRLLKSSKIFEILIKSLGLSLFVFGFSYIMGNYVFAVWSLIITFILAVLVQLYIIFSDLKNRHKKISHSQRFKNIGNLIQLMPKSDTKNIPTIKEKNIFWTSIMGTVLVGIIAGLFSGFAIKIINFGNIWFDVAVFFVLGISIVIWMVWMSKQVTKIK